MPLAAFIDVSLNMTFGKRHVQVQGFCRQTYKNLAPEQMKNTIKAAQRLHCSFVQWTLIWVVSCRKRTAGASSLFNPSCILRQLKEKKQ